MRPTLWTLCPSVQQSTRQSIAVSTLFRIKRRYHRASASVLLLLLLLLSAVAFSGKVLAQSIPPRPSSACQTGCAWAEHVNLVGTLPDAKHQGPWRVDAQAGRDAVGLTPLLRSNGLCAGAFPVGPANGTHNYGDAHKTDPPNVPKHLAGRCWLRRRSGCPGVALGSDGPTRTALGLQWRRGPSPPAQVVC